MEATKISHGKQSVQAFSEKHLLSLISFLPRLMSTVDYSWRHHLIQGCFRTSGFAALFSSYVTVWGYPAKVGKKAYEFSKKMPDVLCFEAIPRCTVWANILSGYDSMHYCKSSKSPMFNQVADLSYSCLVSHLEKQDIVLKSCICGIELLIFSSSFLDEKSKEINQAYYLWGLFVPPKFTFKEPDRN